jgi:hypothetical protein
MGFPYNPSLRYEVSILLKKNLQSCFSSNFLSLNDFNDTIVHSFKKVLKDLTTRFCELTKTMNYKRNFNTNLHLTQ